jgi:hypothetical protein
MAIETLEEAAQAQLRMEDFARRAYAAKLAVEALEDAFIGLGDWPEDIGEAMPQLSRLAKDVADWSFDWAQMSNTDFDPSTSAAD